MTRTLSDIKFSTLINLIAFLGILFNALNAPLYHNFFVVLTVFSGFGLLMNVIDYTVKISKESV